MSFTIRIATLNDPMMAFLGTEVFVLNSFGRIRLEATDSHNPAETARFLDNSANDGLANDFRGVYKEPNSPWIYGSDRNGGLYVFEELGAGSGKK